MTAMTHAMLKGSNVPLDATAVRAVLRWTPGAGVPDVDASALLIGPDGRVRSDEDFVFYNQPRHPSGLVRRLPKRSAPEGLTDTIEADLSALDPSVDQVVIAASCDEAAFERVTDLRISLYDAASAEESRSPSSTCGRRPVRRPPSSAASCTGVVTAGSSGPWRRATRRASSGWPPPSASRWTRPRRRPSPALRLCPTPRPRSSTPARSPVPGAAPAARARFPGDGPAARLRLPAAHLAAAARVRLPPARRGPARVRLPATRRRGGARRRPEFRAPPQGPQFLRP